MNKKALVLFGPEMFSAKLLQMKKGRLQQKKVPKSEEKKTSSTPRYDRNSQRRCFAKIDVLNIFAIIHINTPVSESPF